MADPTPAPMPYQIDLQITPDWNLDQNFQAREAARDEARWQSILQGGNAPVEATGGGGTLGPTEKPSAITEGLKAGAAAFTQGAKSVADALIAPTDIGSGFIDLGGQLLSGLFGMGLAPFVALGAAGGQALENAQPDVAKSPMFQGQEALNVRTALQLRAQADLTPEERQAMSQPITVREALETAVQMVPAMIAPGVKAGKAVVGKVKEAAPYLPALSSERGAIGLPKRSIDAKTGLPLNPDGTVTLYHGTTEAGAKGILETSTLKAAAEPDIYMTTDPGGGGYGDRVIQMRVKPDQLIAEDEFPGGRKDFRINVGKPGGSIPITLEPSIPPDSPFATPPPKTYTPKVNFGRVGAELDVKNLIGELNVKAQKEGRISTEVIHHAETAAKAEAKGLTIEQALKLNYDDLHINATALRDLRDLAFRELRVAQLDSTVSDGRLAAHAVIAGLLEERASATASDMGRGLSALQIISDAERAGGYGPEKIAKLAQDIQKGIIPGESLRARLTQLGFLEQRKTFLRQLVAGAQRGQNMFYEAWINGLLSNPVSHAANTISNATVAAWGIAERQQAGLWNVVRGSVRETGRYLAGKDVGPVLDPMGVHPGEAVVMTRAIVQGSKDGFRLAWRGLITGETGFGGSGKQEIAPALGRNLDLSNPVGGFFDYLGTGIRLPSRLMMSEDALFKGLNYRMELEALAYREGKQMGLLGDALGDFRRAFVANPSAEVQARAEQFALLQTFNKELTTGSFAGRIGMVGQQAQRLPLMRLVIPFMRTPVNISEYAWQRTPVLSLISQQLYADLAAGGAVRDLALARVGTSAMLAAVFMEYSAAGLMTGSGSSQKNVMLRQAEKALGYQSFSIHVGDELYKIDRLDPAGLTLSTLATYAEIAGQIPEGHRAELAVGLVLAISEAIKDKPYFMGLATAIEAVQNPGKEAKTLIEKYARSMIPFSGFVHQTRKIGVPGLVEADRHKRIVGGITEMDTILNAMRDGIPGLSSTLPADMNVVTGEDILYPPGWGPDILSPIFVTTLKNDPVLAEIVRNKPSISDFPKALAGRKPGELQMSEDTGNLGVPLTNEEIRRGKELMGREITDGEGRTLHQALSALVLSGEYQAYASGPGSARSQKLEQTYNIFKHWAINQLRAQSTQLDKAVTTIMEDRINRKFAPGEGAPPIQLAPGLTLPGALAPSLGR